MKKLLVIFLLFYAVGTIKSQSVDIKGKVVDSVTGLPLSFVNITTAGGTSGTYSGINGFFTISVASSQCCLKISYIGYEATTYKIDFNKKNHLIKLKPKPVVLDEVLIVPGKNPAHRIINKAVENRKNNNPENLKEYSYIAYNKMTITVDAPELLEKDVSLLDSLETVARQFLEKQYLFLMENVTLHNHLRPESNQEKILASHVSGFKDPVVIFLLSQLQLTSFYDEKINFAGKNYVNPISKGSIRKYFFQIKDTVTSVADDTTFVISFEPLPGKKFNGLKGVISINNNGWAIQNVKAHPADDTTNMLVNIEQYYKKTDSIWFPYQLKTNILFKNIKNNIGKKTYFTVAKATSYIKNINLHPGLKRRDFGLYKMEIEPDAMRQNESFWNKYRNDTLTQKDLETYRIIDSLGRASHFDRTAAIFRSLLTGKLPIGKVSIDLDNLFRYDVYEGYYLGLGIHTNHKFSKKLKFGGFAGYGFGDKTMKYGGDVSYLFRRATESTISAEYAYKPFESGGVEFFTDKTRMLSPENFGDLFVERKNMTRELKLDYSFRLPPVKYFKWNISLASQHKKAFGNYIFTPLDINSLPQSYQFTKFSFEFYFAYHEKLIQTSDDIISFGTKFPVISFKYTKGLKSVFKSEFSYNKYDLRISDILETKYFGNFIWRFDMGFVDGNLPAPELYSVRGTYRIFTIFAPYTFGTMLANEFLSDRYVSMFLTWDFKDLLLTAGNWKPRLLLITNIGFGSLKHPEYHLNYNFKTMEKGYFESGFIIRQLINLKIMDLGAGILHRYGKYSLDKTADNFTYKISIYYRF